MASKHTAGYQLSQWEKTDKILMEDFNGDNTKIDKALRLHDARLLGVPALGRNLYNLFLQQKNAGQDVSWMQGLVYDDFSDQSKIESMEEHLSWSASEQCIVFQTSREEECEAALTTTELLLNLTHTCGMVLTRCDIFYNPKVEIWDNSGSAWVELDVIDGSRREQNLPSTASIYEVAYLVPRQFSFSKIKLRITLRERYLRSKTFRLYNYCFMAF